MVTEVEFFSFFSFPPCQRAVAGHGGFFFFFFPFFPFFPLPPPCREVTGPVPHGRTTPRAVAGVEWMPAAMLSWDAALPRVGPSQRIRLTHSISCPSVPSPRKVCDALSLSQRIDSQYLLSVRSFPNRSSWVGLDWVTQWLVRSFPSQGMQSPLPFAMDRLTVSPLRPFLPQQIESGQIGSTHSIRSARSIPSMQGLCCPLSSRCQNGPGVGEGEPLLPAVAPQLEERKMAVSALTAHQAKPCCLGRLW